LLVHFSGPVPRQTLAHILKGCQHYNCADNIYRVNNIQQLVSAYYLLFYSSVQWFVVHHWVHEESNR